MVYGLDYKTTAKAEDTIFSGKLLVTTSHGNPTYNKKLYRQVVFTKYHLYRIKVYTSVFTLAVLF